MNASSMALPAARNASCPDLARTLLSDPRRNASVPALPSPQGWQVTTQLSPVPPNVSIAKGAAYAVIAGTAAGISFPLIALSSRGTGPFSSACLMQTGAALVAGAAALTVPQDGRHLLPVNKRTAGLLAAAAASGAFLAPATMVAALHNASASGVSLTMNIEPFVGALAAWPLFRQRPSSHMCMAGLMAVGSSVLCAVGQLKEQPGSLKGIGLAAASSAGWAGWDLALFGLHEIRPAEVVGAAFTMGAAACGILAGALSESFPHDANIAKLIGCGALAFGVTDTMILLALRHMGVGRASLMCVTMGLIVGTTVSAAMGQGPITPLIGASLGVAIVGSAILASEHFLRHAAPLATPSGRQSNDVEMAPRATV
jgi:drug/metabolite transporter (DMT)-like permease